MTTFRDVERLLYQLRVVRLDNPLLNEFLNQTKLKAITDADSPYDPAYDDFVFVCDANANNVFINLPYATQKQMLLVVRTDSNPLYTVGLSPQSGDTTDGGNAIPIRGWALCIPEPLTQVWHFVSGRLDWGVGGLVVIDSGIATLSGGLATVTTANIHTGTKVLLTPQDVNILGTPRKDNVIDGVSFDINSTGATDDGVVLWCILG